MSLADDNKTSSNHSLIFGETSPTRETSTKGQVDVERRHNPRSVIPGRALTKRRPRALITRPLDIIDSYQPMPFIYTFFELTI